MRERSQRSLTLSPSSPNFGDELLSAVLTTLGDALVIRDVEGRAVLMSTAFERILGYPRDMTVGSTVDLIADRFRFADGTLVPRESLAFSRVLKSGEPVYGEEVQYERPDGKTVWLRVNATPLRDRTGSIVGVVTSYTDVTARTVTQSALEKSEKRFSEFVQQSPDMISYENINGVFEYVSPASRNILGYEPEEMVGRNSEEFVHPDERHLVQRRHQTTDLDRFNALFRGQHKDGSYRWLDTSCTAVRDRLGTAEGFFVICRDVTERRHAEAAIVESEAALSLAQEIAHLGSFECDVASSAARWSTELYRIFGVSPETCNVDAATLRGFDHPDDAEAIHAAIDEARVSGDSYGTEHRIVRHDGSVRWVFERGVVTFAGPGKHALIAGTVLDTTERKLAEERASYLARHDALTRLPNRLVFADRLEQAIALAGRNQRCAAVLCLDLDRFKIVNDTLGHTIGDSVIQTMADRLRACLRDGDVLSRAGGDAFLAVLADVAHVDDVAFVADKMLHAVSRACTVDGRELVLTASVGASVFPNDGAAAEHLIMNAESAMYRAKTAGGDNCQLTRADLQSRADERLSIEHGLRLALRRGELVLHYQPIVNIISGRLAGCEALLRWQPPGRELVYPNAFIGIAEETGLIVPIGAWVLEEVCRQRRAWSENGVGTLIMSLNISARQLQHAGLVSAVARAVDQAGCDPSALELEVTESAVMQDAEMALGLLNQLKDRGVRLCVDDFGTGFSSLSYLKRFPLDTIKIDRTFIHDLETDEHDAAIAKSIVNLAHSLKLTVVAEGVETAGQLALLRNLGCDRMQGYYFSRPITAESFEALVREDRRLV